LGGLVGRRAHQVPVVEEAVVQAVVYVFGVVGAPFPVPGVPPVFGVLGLRGVCAVAPEEAEPEPQAKPDNARTAAVGGDEGRGGSQDAEEAAAKVWHDDSLTFRQYGDGGTDNDRAEYRGEIKEER